METKLVSTLIIKLMLSKNYLNHLVHFREILKCMAVVNYKFSVVYASCFVSAVLWVVRTQRHLASLNGTT